MSQPEMGFRTAAFGFRREDVLEFIAQEADNRQKIEIELEQVREDAEQLRAEKEEADKAAKALLSEHERILSEIEDKDVQIKTLQEEVQSAKNAQAALQEKLDKLHRENEALQKVLDDAQMENTDLSSKCTEYAEARDRLAEIELCAHGRAEKIQQRAEQDACALVREAQDMAEHLLKTIEETKDTYWQALRSAEQERERAHVNAVDALSKLDEIMDDLRGRVTAQTEPQPNPNAQNDLLLQTEQECQEQEQKDPLYRQAADDAGYIGRERPTLAQVLGALRGGK